jgi:uncharacterized BrkB/YihY/UPF0761 family membrane protein
MSGEPDRSGDPVEPGDPKEAAEPSTDAEAPAATDVSAATEGSIAERVTGRVDQARSLAADTASAAEERWPPIRVVRTFIGRYIDVNGVVLAGHLAFRAFTFLLPVAVVVVAVAGFATSAGQDPGATADNQLKLGQALADSLRTAGRDASTSPYHVALVALLGLMLGALGLLSGLNYVYREAWQIEERKLEGKFTKLLRFIFAFVLIMALLSGASALRNGGFLIGVAGTLGMSAVFFFAFLGLGLIMPRRCEEWYWLVPGSIVGAAAFVGLQAFATFYLPRHLTSLSETYGALGLAVVLIGYLFLLGHVVVASALASAVWFDDRHAQQALPPAPSPAPPGSLLE